jgi:hypothetical protein
MAEQPRDDYNPTTPSGEDEKNPPSMQPRGDATTEEIGNSEAVEAVEEDERINDRFQATDN